MTNKNPDIEKEIIGQLLLPGENKYKLPVLIELDNDLFENPKYKKILEVISKLVLVEKEADILSVYQNLNGEISANELTEYTSGIISIAGIESNIGLLKARKYKKKLVKVVENYTPDIKSGTFPEDLEQLKNHLIADLLAVELEDKSEFINIQEFTEKIKTQIDSKKEIEGYSWGIKKLDEWTSGIVKPMVYVIGGLKKSGKSRFVIHTLTKLHNKEIPAAFLSLEMPGFEVTKLLYASLTGMNDLRFRSASFMNHEEKALFENTEINQMLLGIECKSGLNLGKVLSRIRRYAKMGYQVIFIDYLQRINHNRNNQANELEDISIKISDAARQNNVAIVMLSQLNNTAEKEVPNMGQLKGSGGIGESADSIILFDNLYRRTKLEKDRGQIDLYIEQRYGDSGKLTIQADLGSCRFNDIAQGNESDQAEKYSYSMFN